MRRLIDRSWLASALLVGTLLADAAWASTLRRGLGPEPDSLHIHQAQGLAAVNLLRDLREGLVTFGPGGELVPGQAASWEVLDGGATFRFVLRDEARWSNGDVVTGDDFVRAWRRAVAPESAAATAALLRDVRNASAVLDGRAAPEALGITAPEPGIVEVRLERPVPWFLEILTHPVSFPLHAGDRQDARGAPMNGPFVIEEWTPRANIRLLRNPFFHAASSLSVERVDYFPIEQPAAELARYRAGELDITETIPAGRFEWIRENLDKHLRVYPYLGTFWLGLNFRHPLLGGSRTLRQALALAIDRDILVRTVLGAGEQAAWSIVPPGLAGYQPAQMAAAHMTQAEREALAVELFRQSGAGRREPLLLELRYNTSTIHRRMAVAVAAMWRQVLGVNTQLVNEEWKVFVNNRKMGVVTEVFRGGWIADFGDPASFLDLFLSGDSLSGTFYADADYDMLMKAAGVARGQARLDALRQAEATLLQDLPVIPLYYYVSRHLVNPAVGGFVDNVRDVHLSRYLYLQSGAP